VLGETKLVMDERQRESNDGRCFYWIHVKKL